MTKPGQHLAQALALVLMFASGAAGLVWQMVWTAQLGLALGHEMIAVLSVMAAFFGGLGVGALLLANWLEHSRHPGRCYALLEAVIGGWALLVSLVSPVAMAQLSRWIGAEPSAAWHWSTAFFVPFILLLPATVAMGATLPAMERLLRNRDGQPLGMLYATNTAGAVVGLLLAVFYFIPGVGLVRTALLFAGVNLACAAAAWYAWGQAVQVGMRVGSQRSGSAAGTASSAPGVTIAGCVVRLFFSGLLGVGYEVLAVRVLAQVTENTVYTYALLLADFLIGTALGAFLLQRARVDGAISAQRIDRAIGVLVVSILVGGLALWWADHIYLLPVRWFGPGLGTALAGEFAAGAAAMLLPAMAMGALFTLLCRQAQQTGMPLGLAFGINTVGATLAPIMVGLFMLPTMNAQRVLLALLVGYLANRTFRSWNRPFGWLAIAAVLGIGLFASPLRFAEVPIGGRLLSYREGVMAAVSVVEDAEGVARLHINNRVQEGSSASGLVETRLAQLPLLMHAMPGTALFLGYGTGYTSNAAALDPQVRVKAVELLPEVIDAAGIFALRAERPVAAQPVTVVPADARRYVQATSDRYDVIVSDLFQPARSGAGSLYTVEHFSAVRSKLQPGGVFCQWLALYQMDIETLRSIVAAFLQVYPDAVAVLANNSLDTPVVGLIARPDQPGWRIDAVRNRLSNAPPSVTAALRSANINDPFAVLGSVIAGPEALRQFAGDAAVNTDDHPVVAHRAPWISYASRQTARERLAILMHAMAQVPKGILSDPNSADAARLLAYWKARGAYLALGMTVQPDPDPRVMLGRLQAPLLRIVATSPDFRPAAEPLAALARAVRSSDPDLAAQVEADLQRALIFQPSSTSH